MRSLFGLDFYHSATFNSILEGSVLGIQNSVYIVCMMFYILKSVEMEYSSITNTIHFARIFITYVC